MKYLSIVSGTSTDGLTLSLIEISGSGLDTEYDIINTKTYLYEPDLKKDLLKIASNGDVTVGFVSRVHWGLGRVIDRCAADFSNQFDVISYSGHTVYHGPSNGDISNGTFQIGEISILSARSGKTAVTDFRASDMAYGGLGAPLTAVSDYFILKNAGTMGLNIGGISNISYIGEDTVTAFDTGPGNMLIDTAARRLFGKDFDEGGLFASEGEIDADMLKYLMSDPFLGACPPKTSGREYFNEAYFERVFTKFKSVGKHDFIRTLTRFTSEAVFNQVSRFLPNAPELVVAGGGGVLNPVIMADLKELFSGNVKTFSDIGVDNMSREALGFAILANQTLKNKPGRISDFHNLTGEVIGKIIPGRNYDLIVSSFIR